LIAGQFASIQSIQVNQRRKIYRMPFQNLIAGLSCWFMAAGALMAWWWPQYLGAGAWLDYLGGIGIMEFLVIHSTAMLAGIALVYAQQSRLPDTGYLVWLLLAAIVGMAGFYLLLAYVVATEVESISLFAGFLGLLLSRLAGFLGPIRRHELMRSMYRSFFSLGLFFIGIIVARVVPFPAGAVRSQWVGEYAPAESMLAVIVMYFLLLGLFEFKVPQKLPDRFL